MIPKISEKDTKSVLIEKFNALAAHAKAIESSKVDPKIAIHKKENEATISGAEATVNTNIVSKVDDIVSLFTKNLNNTAEEIKALQNEYYGLQSAISLKKVELKEVFNIADTAFALFALVDVQNEQIDKFDKDMAEKKAKAQAALEEILIDAANKKEALKVDIEQLKRQAEVDRKRDEEEYLYDRDRQRDKDADEWADERKKIKAKLADEIKAEAKALEEQHDNLEIREKAIEEREENMDGLELKVESIPGLVDIAVKEAVGKVKASAEKSHSFEKALAEKDRKAAEELSNTRIEQLEDSLAAEKDRNKILESKLDAAYSKIESISNTAVKAASGTRYIEKTESPSSK